MNFKDMVKRDIDSILLNLDEFGEEVCIDGYSCVAVFDKSNSNVSVLENGTSIFPVTLTTKSENLSENLVKGGSIDIDGVLYIILDIQTTMGLTDIKLQRNGY